MVHSSNAGVFFAQQRTRLWVRGLSSAGAPDPISILGTQGPKGNQPRREAEGDKPPPRQATISRGRGSSVRRKRRKWGVGPRRECWGLAGELSSQGAGGR